MDVAGSGGAGGGSAARSGREKSAAAATGRKRNTDAEYADGFRAVNAPPAKQEASAVASVYDRRTLVRLPRAPGESDRRS